MKPKQEVLVAMVIAAFVAVFLFHRQNASPALAPTKPTVKTVSELASKATQHAIDLTQEVSWANGKTPVLIYSETVAETDTNGRGYPTIKIWRKMGAQPYEELATVGKVGEFPNSVSLSSDKKFLLVNLESKLQRLDLATKELRDLFVPKESTYLGAVFSPDKKELFIWDQFYAEEDKQYYVHRFNIETQEDSILLSGNNGHVYGPDVWRDDKMIILYEPLGEVGLAWYFDLRSNKLKQSPNDLQSGFTSKNGHSMALTNQHVDDICNDFAGSTASGYRILDPVTGALQGRLTQQGRPANITAFSPDQKKFLYTVRQNHTSRDDCPTQYKPSGYFVSDYNGKNNRKISLEEYLVTKNSWDYDDLNISHDQDYENNHQTLSINGKPIVDSSLDLAVIAQYLQ